jgi:hypothetical protein
LLHARSALPRRGAQPESSTRGSRSRRSRPCRARRICRRVRKLHRRPQRLAPAYSTPLPVRIGPPGMKTSWIASALRVPHVNADSLAGRSAGVGRCVHTRVGYDPRSAPYTRSSPAGQLRELPHARDYSPRPSLSTVGASDWTAAGRTRLARGVGRSPT